MNNYVDYEELEIEMEKIKSNITDFQSFLDTIENTISEVETTNSTFKGLNFSQIGKGEPVADAATALATSLMKLQILVKRVFIKESSIDSYCASSESEIDNMRDRLSSILRAIDNAEESILVIARYLQEAEKIFQQQNPESEAEISFGEQFHEAINLMMNDAANGYSILHSTPVLMNGDVNMRPGQSGSNEITYSGPYLQFFNEHGIEVIAPMAHMGLDTYQTYTETEINDNASIYTQYYNRIMDNINNRFTDFHRQALRENLSRIILEDSDYRDSNGNPIARENAGLTDIYNPSYNLETTINMPMRTLLDNPNDINQWEYPVDAFTHETGHVLDNYLAKLQYQQGNNPNNDGYYSTSNENYMMYYNLLEETDTINNADDLYNVGGFRGYAFANPAENFAESVAEYYGDGNGYAHYSPDDLKATRIQVFFPSGENRVMSLYEVFDNILNGRDFYG